LYAGLPVVATRSYVYDGFERLCKRIDPEAGGTLFEYDGVGNLTGSAEGQSSSLSCNAIPAAARISRSYDARDRLLSYGYNNRRLLTSEALSFGDTYTFSYSYNALGHLASSSTPGNLTIDFAPNALGQPGKAGSFASGATYFPDGSLKQFSYGNGLVHAVTQNARHLPLRVRDALGAQVVHDFSYGYDQNGNVTAITDADQTGLQSKSLLYDARDRLTSASAPQLWGVASYAYDPLDNLRSADQGSRQYRYQYDANNRLTRLTDPTGTPLPGLDFAYDAQGRQIRKGTQTRSFDGANRITAINGETYAYDGNGRRIATWASDGRTKVEVYTQNGQLGFAVDSAKGGGSSFVYLAGQPIAEDHWNCGSNSHTASYFHADALGSPVATTDAARTVLERTYYAPYGEALNRTVDGPGYTGHVMDAATGLVYAQQRYYDPLVGKFLSVDPVAADPNSGGNFNRYWYANDNPYKFTDPDGRDPGFSGFGTNFKPGPGCNETGTCVSLEQSEKNFQGEGMKVGGVGLVIPALLGGGGAVIVAAEIPAVLGAVAKVGKEFVAKKSLELGVKAKIAIDETTAAASVATESVAARVATNPVLVAAGANGDKIAQAASGALEPGPPPMTPTGVISAVVTSIVNDEVLNK
jgi:RHS repeat-associated protein